MSLTRRQFALGGAAAALALPAMTVLAEKAGKTANPQGLQSAPDLQSAPHDMSSMPEGWVRSDQIALLVYPQMTALDMVAPQYAFASLMGATVHLVAKTRDPVVSDTGLTILPTAIFDECPMELDAICIPGGSSGTLAAMDDDETLDFIADRGSRAKFVTSVCTGSLLLGAAGLLKGYRATSHWGALPILKEFGAVPVDGRVVEDRNRLTGGGVTAGMDLGLSVVARLRDDFYAQGVQLMAEYAPQPPFNAGTPSTAPQAVFQMMDEMFVGFRAEATALAKTIASARNL
jgi:cyclohexyl-isocyanide hydratase